MAKHYTINHTFARKGVFYTRDNEAALAELPAPDRKDLVDRGFITEHDAPTKKAGGSKQEG